MVCSRAEKLTLLDGTGGHRSKAWLEAEAKEMKEAGEVKGVLRRSSPRKRNASVATMHLEQNGGSRKRVRKA